MDRAPKADHKMSLYGTQEANPVQKAGEWREFMKDERLIHSEHLAVRGNGTSVWPGEPKTAAAGTFFGSAEKNARPTSNYDRMFHFDFGYNSRLAREDSQHKVGLNVAAEEEARRVPVRSSAVYGLRVGNRLEDILDTREHARVERIGKGFYTTGGTGIPTSSTSKLTL